MLLRVKWLPTNLVFFVLCFLYLWLVVEPHLIYHCFGTILPGAPQFATGWSFLRDSLSMPGGPVAYVSGFLSQGYYHAWLGAAVIVLVAFSLATLARRHLVAAGLAEASVLASFPAIMVFLVYSRYKHPLAICLAVSLGLLLSLAFERLPLRRSVVRLGAYCLMAALGFWLGGGGTLLIFTVVTVVHRIFLHRDWTVVAIALPAGVVISWTLAEYVFLIPVRQALLILTPFESAVTAGMNTLLKVLVLLLYCLAPLTVLLVSVGKSVFGGRRKKPRVRAKKTGGIRRYAVTERTSPFPAIITKAALSAVPIALMALGLYFSYDAVSKPFVLSNYYSRQKDWDKIVELSLRLPKNRVNVYVNHDTIRALYHTGRLPYDMFCCPLVPEAILLTHEDRQSVLTQWKLSDVYLELGHVNIAQKLASELVTTQGRLGIALEELAWINIIKGHPRTARVYLTALKKDLIYRRRAMSLLRTLDGGLAPNQAAAVTRIRSRMRGEAAGVTGSEPVDETLAALLEHNPQNRMAFEYLMACYLVTKRVDKILEHVERLRDLGYRRVPTLYQEAILIHHGSRGQAIELAKYNISPETLQRYEMFMQIANAMQGPNRRAASQRLIRDFGTSYFFYFAFGRVGPA
ncbi:MAG: hypothetical protein JSU70_23045 [Phycisphaerales bacterium]|nr:MAG: hypothetical protein JSU70_23045 [Phycisphaerales bacterium]